MRLKKIDSKTAIHCKSMEQAKILHEEGICGDWIFQKDFPVWISNDNGWMPEIYRQGKTGKEIYEDE